MRYFFAVWLFLAMPAAAEDWTQLNGGEIRDALADAILDYEDAWQVFHASGRTLYNAGGDSLGKWDVSGDQYCSQWPPNTAWTCYDVDLNAGGDQVRFRGRGDNVTVGTYRNAE